MKKKKGVYFKLDDTFEVAINFMGTKALVEVLEDYKIISRTPKHDELVLPTKFNKYIDDVVVARIILSEGKRQFGKLYVSTQAFVKMHDAICMHVVDKILSETYHKWNKKKPVKVSEFFGCKK